jgi:NitT/TauT family transport system substrate-binding protein
MRSTQSRRRFLATLSSAGAAGLVGAPDALTQEAPLETTTIRFQKNPSICGAPLYVANGLLRAEGFTDIRYLPTDTGVTGAQLAARGEIDFENAFIGPLIMFIDAGQPITLLGGLHIGCYELFAHEGIRSIRDLKGRSVAVPHLGSSPQVLVSVIAAYVGLGISAGL